MYEIFVSKLTALHRARLYAHCGYPALASLGGAVAVVLLTAVGGAEALTAGQSASTLAAVPVFFEQNIGQHNSGKFRAIGSGFSVIFEDGRANINTKGGHAISMVFHGRDAASPQGDQRAATRVDYFTGHTKQEWRLNVPVFRKVRYAGAYPGVDIVYYASGRFLEYDFVVSPGADPGNIRFRIEGARHVNIDGKGSLLADTGDGYVHRHARPRAYQISMGRQISVESRFILLGNGDIGFEVGAYDRTSPLIIDPVLTFSTYIGSDLDDEGVDVAADTAGNVYVLGNVLFHSNAPGAFGTNKDAFLYKLSPDGRTVLYSAVIGGAYTDEARGLAINGSGKAYITGSTSSSDFPITSNAYLATPRKTPNAFICAIDTNAPTESSLLYSSHFPADAGKAIAVDIAGDAYITGVASWGFTATPGAFQTTCPTCSWTTDAFVAKFDFRRTGGASLIYSTYLGGSSVPVLGTGSDVGLGIVVDSTGEAVVTGQASSSDFPTRNAVDSSYNGGITDAFVTKINASGTGLVFSTLLGTEQFDSGQGIALDPSGNIYVAGITNWYGFPTTAGAWQANWNANQCGATVNDPCPDAFVTKLSPAGTLLYSTYLGGILPDYAYDVAVDSSGSAYVAGHTISANFPLVSPLTGVSAGANDAFITKLNAAGTGILFSTLIGGSGTDEGKAIALSGSQVIVVGTTIATNFPVVQAGQPSNAGGTDAFIVKFPLPSLALPALNTLTVSPATVVSGANATGTVTLTKAAPAGGSAITLTSSNTAAATVPATVTVAAGTTSATFTITSKSVTVSTGVTVSAVFSGVTKTAALTVSPAPLALSSLVVSPTSIIGGANATGTVKLTKAAPAGGSAITLKSSNTAVAAVPATVTIAAGATSASFAITSKSVTTSTGVTVSAAFSGVTKTAALTVTPAPPVLSTFTITPTSVVGGSTAKGAVTLSKAAPTGGSVVALTSSSTAAATVPSTVTIAAGASSAAFTITTKSVTASTAVSISAVFGGVTKKANVTVSTLLSSLTIAPTSVVRGASATGTVKLGKAAPTGGYVVTLASSNTAAATVPASITVPAGATSANFPITTKSVSTSTAVSVSAVLSGVTKKATLTVTAP